jgi:hypothetical protein
MPLSNNLRVGRPDTTPDAPSHVPGIQQGNSPAKRDPGNNRVGAQIKADARRSTSINPEARNPITPNAPNLPPA